jgi:hypothetical protein
MGNVTDQCLGPLWGSALWMFIYTKVKDRLQVG